MPLLISRGSSTSLYSARNDPQVTQTPSLYRHLPTLATDANLMRSPLNVTRCVLRGGYDLIGGHCIQRNRPVGNASLHGYDVRPMTVDGDGRDLAIVMRDASHNEFSRNFADIRDH